MITYRQITTADPEYAAEKSLRAEVLRAPLGLTLTETDVRGEDRQIHLLACDANGAAVGCVLIVPAEDGTARIRQMAVAGSERGKGIGAGLMGEAERIARATAIRKLTMHARLSARGFYERLGYRVTSEIFLQVTVPHVTMEKTLDQERSAPNRE